MKPVVIRRKKDATRIPAACILILVVLGGGALIRMSVKVRLNERRAAAASLAADAASRLTTTLASAADPGLCRYDPATLALIVRAVDPMRLADSDFDYELSCATQNGEQPRIIARSTGRALMDPVRHVSYGRTSVWAIAVAPQPGWMPWGMIAVQGLLVFVTALFAVLAITTLARRPAQLRGELDARDRRLKAVHERLAREIQQREALESLIRHAGLPDPLAVLPNRGCVIDRVSRAQQRARHHPAARIAVIVIGLERITPIDEDRLSAVDDELVLQAVRRLQGCLETTEYSIARVAEDAVALLLIGVASKESVKAAAVVLHQALAQAFTIGGRLVFVHPNMGIALATSGDENPEQLVRAAKLAFERKMDEYRASLDTATREVIGAPRPMARAFPFSALRSAPKMRR